MHFELLYIKNYCQEEKDIRAAISLRPRKERLRYEYKESNKLKKYC
jgi:hypothetical protein